MYSILSYLRSMERVKVLLTLIIAVMLLTSNTAVAASTCPTHPVLQHVPTPQSVLGYTPGDDYRITPYADIVNYMRLVERASNRVKMVPIGSSTDGREMYIFIITSQKNHVQLDHYRSIVKRLSEPQNITEEEASILCTRGKPIVWITCTIHSGEMASSEMAMELMYKLAAFTDPETNEILENVIFLLTPSINPDGRDMVAEWYYKYLGTPYEGTSPPYTHRYVSHDLNRDFYAVNMQEVKVVVKAFHEWLPQIHWDMHQMGSNGPRLFVPPHLDPMYPTIDPIVKTEFMLIGGTIMNELISKGMGGVVMNAVYDHWFPQPASVYGAFHTSCGILTEAASSNLASPRYVEHSRLSSGRNFDCKQESWNFPLVWQGDRYWYLRDVVDYEMNAAWSVLRMVARNRFTWLWNFYKKGSNSVQKGLTEPPFAYVIPPEQKDPAATAWMLDRLIYTGAKVYSTKSSFTAGGTTYPAGTYVIPTAQPNRTWVKALMEIQHYPMIMYEGKPFPPYDLAGWTFPIMAGVNARTVNESFSASLSQVKDVTPPAGEVIGGPASYAYIIGHESENATIAVNRLLKAGYDVYWAAEAFASGGNDFPVGTIIVPAAANLYSEMQSIAKSLGLKIYGTNGKISAGAYRLELPRLALYYGNTQTMGEGWIRFLLEQYEFSFIRITDADVKAGNLKSKFDVIIIPDMTRSAIINGAGSSYPLPGGIGTDGVAALRNFVLEGGTLLLKNQASDLAIREFGIGVTNKIAGLPTDQFYCPGTLLNATVNNAHPISYGYDYTMSYDNVGYKASIFFDRSSPVFDVTEGTVVLGYPSTEQQLFLSGYILGPQYFYNSAALVDVPLGDGRVILFGFNVMYRAQSHSTYNLFFNSIYYGASTATSLP